MADVFIRSYHDYSVRFEIPGGAVVIPSKHAKPSTIKVTEEQFKILAGDGTEKFPGVDEFRVLLETSKGGYRKVDSMPRDQVDLIERISQAQDDIDAAKLEAAKHAQAAKKATEELEALQRKVDEQGGIESVSAEVDKAREEARLAKEEAENLAAEVAALKAKLEKKPKAEKTE